MIKYNLVVPSTLTSQLLDFALISGVDYFKPNPSGPKRRSCNLNLHNLELSHQVRVFSQQCFSKVFGIQIDIKPVVANFLGVNETDAFVNEHQDWAGPNGECHTRLNFLIQKPEGGGMPVIEGNVLAVEQGQCWINLASKWKHWSTPVVGNRPRVVLSLGAYLPESVVSNIVPSVI